MTAERQATNETPATGCPNPIFVIGSPRSGTTILATSLGRHGGLSSGEESVFLFELFRAGHLEAVYKRCMARPKPTWLRENDVSYSEFLAHLGQGINNLFTSRSGGKRWIEQTPHYALIADVLSGLLPGAQFVHILRDAREVVDSMINVTRRFTTARLEAARQSGHLPRWPDDFRHACKSWKSCVEKSLAFCSAHPDRGMTVSYSNLVADPDDEFRRMFDFFGLTYEDGPAKYFSSTRINSSFYEEFSNPKQCEPRREPWKKWDRERKVTFLSQLAPALVEHGMTEALDLGAPSDDELAPQFTAVVQALVPIGGTAIVLNAGSGTPIELPGRQVRTVVCADGRDALGNRGDGATVGHLESLRTEGAGWFLITRSALAWLDRCRELADDLNTRFRLLFRIDHLGAAYDLRASPKPVANQPTDYAIAGRTEQTREGLSAKG